MHAEERRRFEEDSKERANKTQPSQADQQTVDQ